MYYVRGARTATRLNLRAVESKSDDQGKPLPKKDYEIPLFGRIVALADVYDALSSRHSYKEAWNEDKVLAVIKEESGKHFDPELVEAFFSSLSSIKAVSRRYE